MDVVDTAVPSLETDGGTINTDGADLGLDLADAFGAGVEIGHRPFEGPDAGFLGEGLCGLVVAGVIGRDLIPCILQGP